MSLRQLPVGTHKTTQIYPKTNTHTQEVCTEAAICFSENYNIHRMLNDAIIVTQSTQWASIWLCDVASAHRESNAIEKTKNTSQHREYSLSLSLSNDRYLLIFIFIHIYLYRCMLIAPASHMCPLPDLCVWLKMCIFSSPGL